MLQFVKSQWKGMVVMLSLLLVLFNVWGMLAVVQLVNQRAQEAHIVFDQLRAILEQQKPKPPQP